MIKISFGLLSLILFLFASCQSQLKTEEEVYSYIQDESHGALAIHEFNGIKISMSYIPKKLISKSNLLSGDLKYFRLIYQNRGKDMLSSIDQNMYSVLLNRLSFRLGEYLSVYYGGKQKELSDYQFSPLYGVTNSTEVLVAIDLEKISGKNIFTFNLKDIGLGLSEYDFNFKISDLEKLDKLTEKLKINE